MSQTSEGKLPHFTSLEKLGKSSALIFSMNFRAFHQITFSLFNVFGFQFSPVFKSTSTFRAFTRKSLTHNIKGHWSGNIYKRQYLSNQLINSGDSNRGLSATIQELESILNRMTRWLKPNNKSIAQHC